MLWFLAQEEEVRKLVNRNIRALADIPTREELERAEQVERDEAELFNPFPGIMRSGPSGTIGG